MSPSTQVPPFTVLPRGTEVDYLEEDLTVSRAIIVGISLSYTDYSTDNELRFRYMIRRVDEQFHFHVDHRYVSQATERYEF